jgi:thymidine phosphorylase
VTSTRHASADDAVQPATGAGGLATRNALRLRDLGIDTYREKVVYMRADCHIARSLGITVQSRVEVTLGPGTLEATVDMVTGDLLGAGEAGLSAIAWRALGAHAGDCIVVSHAPAVESLSHVRAKVYGHRLADDALRAIVTDITAGRYSDLELAAFVTACAGDRLDAEETIGLTRAMIHAGRRMSWERHPIMDKHSVGGLPGNRTTPVVVPIVAAAGMVIPKTSSRAITSPAGTADTMEVLAPVDLGEAAMRRVVEREGGCIVWGGSIALSPADDILIGIERPLALDSEGQLVASVLSKKAAAGATHVVVDMPVGLTAKVRSMAAADQLAARLSETGRAIGMDVRILVSDGSQPVGRGIGPALEARDVLAVLQGQRDAPVDLRERALALAASVLEMGGAARPGDGLATARAILDDGRAWTKFVAICEAQGGLREPPGARVTREFVAPHAGTVVAIDNRRLARVAKLAGAPQSAAAGLDFHAPLGASVARGQPLFVVHAGAPGELDYAFDYLAIHSDIVMVAPAP